MVKPRNHKERVTQQFHWCGYQTVASNVLLATLTDLAPTTAALGSYSDQVANYLDMYRFAKIESLRVEVQAAAATTNTWNAWLVNYIAPGAAAPSNLLGIETKNAVMGCGLAGVEYSRAILAMTGDSFAVLADGAPGPGWIPTQGDGPATTFGTLQLTSMVPAGGAGTIITFVHKMSITISFDTLVDPATISLRMSRRKGKGGPESDSASSSLEGVVTEVHKQLDRLTALASGQ